MTNTTKYLTLIPVAEELRGERVLLRPYHLEDAEELFASIERSREHLTRWLPWAHEHTSITYTRDLILRWQAKWLLREELPMGIWESASGQLLGGIGLHIRSWDVPAFEIGYWLAREHEGKGYMTEAVRVLTDYAFDALAAQRVEIRCDARNERSAQVARRLGFVQEGHLRNDRRGADGSIRSTLVFALTPDDPRWPTR